MSVRQPMSVVEPPSIADRLAAPGHGINRRTLLSLGGSAFALAATGLAPVLAAAQPLPPVRFVVTDRRHPASVAFGQRLLPAGGASLEVTEGLTRLWREVLLPHWQHGAAGAVAGLTTREVWACLAEQARSHALFSTSTDTRTDSLVSWVIG